MAQGFVDSEYKQQLQAEKDNLDPAYVHAGRLLAEELDRVQTGGGKGKYTEIHHDKPIRLTEKILLPVAEYPKLNFVGRLIGPGGANMKALQERTGCKFSVLGRGTMKDKKKEDELRAQGGKYAHLNEEQHVLVEVFGTAGEGHIKLGHAINEIRKYLSPEFDDGTYNQNGAATGQPAGFAGPPPPAPPGMMPPAPGMPAARPPRGVNPGVRGAMAPRPPGPPGARGQAPPMRGMPPAGRGAPPRPVVPNMAAPQPNAYGQQSAYPQQMTQMEDPYASVDMSQYGMTDQSQDHSHSHYMGGYEQQSFDPYSMAMATTEADMQQAAEQQYSYSTDYSTSDQWNLDQSSYGKAAVSKASNAARQQPYSTVGVARGAGGATRGNSASTGRGTGRGAGAAGASRGGMHR